MARFGTLNSLRPAGELLGIPTLVPGAGTWVTRVPALSPFSRPSAVLGHLFSSKRPPPRVTNINTVKPPFMWICHLAAVLDRVIPEQFITPEQKGQSSGVLISPRHVLTAGHCILSVTEENKFPPALTSPVANDERKLVSARKVNVTRALNNSYKGDAATVTDPHPRPFWRAGLSGTTLEFPVRTGDFKLRVAYDWEGSGAQNVRYDFGLLTLDKPLMSFWSGNRFKIGAPKDLSPGETVQNAGYPALPCDPLPSAPGQSAPVCEEGTTLRHQSGKVLEDHPTQPAGPELMFCDLFGHSGLSGSPVWWVREQSTHLVGIMSTGFGEVLGDKQTFARTAVVLLTEAVLQQLRAWVSRDGVHPTF
jgi:hypothetical protein